MKRLTRYFLSSVGMVVSSMAIADITFFDGTNFSGRRMALDRPSVNFRDAGFNEQSQSVVVGESWEVCTDRNFGGECTVLAAGRYPTLGAWSNRISSARPVATAMAPAPVAAAPTVGVTFFETEQFGGRRLRLEQSAPDFQAARLSDQPGSAIVEGLSWEFCTDVGFRGGCQALAPGRYPSLANFGGRISSARPLTQPAVQSPPVRPIRAGAVLFSGPSLTGRAFPLGGDGESNLDGLFNDRAVSLRVERGYWLFCSDAGFRGTCRTFGPGDYATLPYELEGRISSGRRIANDYPYNQSPTWR